MDKKKINLKTFKYEEFQTKVEEGHDVGFDTYKRNVEMEEEDTSVDDLGEGDVITDEAPIETEVAPDIVEPNSDEIDTGEVDVSVTDVEEKIREMLKITKIMKTADLKNIYKDINAILAKYPL